jgi:hypothetical protein
VNYWKRFVHEGFATVAGDRGCISLFGKDARQHELFAEHVARSEKWVDVTGPGGAGKESIDADPGSPLHTDGGEQLEPGLAESSPDEGKEIADGGHRQRVIREVSDEKPRPSVGVACVFGKYPSIPRASLPGDVVNL